MGIYCVFVFQAATIGVGTITEHTGVFLILPEPEILPYFYEYKLLTLPALCASNVRGLVERLDATYSSLARGRT